MKKRSRGESGGLKERKLRRGTIWAVYCSSNRANGRRIIHVRVGCFYFHSFIQPSCWLWLLVEYHSDSNMRLMGFILHVRDWQSGFHLLSFLIQPSYCSWLSVECCSIYSGIAAAAPPKAIGHCIIHAFNPCMRVGYGFMLNATQLMQRQIYIFPFDHLYDTEH